jgi:hypothetical protein
MFLNSKTCSSGRDLDSVKNNETCRMMNRKVRRLNSDFNEDFSVKNIYIIKYVLKS